ncbi:23S rRNA (uracil(1939)-C(5))-methyltransferase RlmD [Marinospirillum perlucidum]|uniref:23S rRNA (uracil(1939)-C(5))-methyltransferase RlmD n=1 Tax=Marinospirillum perlucidum TaxID=1982602 RepID=UPI000DF3EA45|nr:23S rRNA (uracil(1939)-C(5))-methyltransferase RlmD [Marinospirillum perlucidum]
MSRLFTKPRKKKTKPSAAAHPTATRTPSTQAPSSELHPDGVQILRLSHEGRGVARQENGKTLFVEGALPGEWVTVQRDRCLSRYDEGRIQELLVASDQRVEPVCPHYLHCGGCQLQHLEASAQLDYKQRQVAEQLDFPLEQMAEPLVGPQYGYRRRARLGVKWRKDGELLLGFREKNSARITATPECRILTPALQQLLPDLYAFLPRLEGGRHIGHLELLEAEGQLGIEIRWLRSYKRFSPADKRLWQDWAEERGIHLWLKEASERHLLTRQEPDFSYRLGDLEIGFAPGDFIQVNAEVNRQLVSQALDWLDLRGDEQLLDLFCGLGNFTLPLAQHAQRVVGVEALESQVERGRQNALRNRLDNLEWQAADLEGSLAQQSFANLTWDGVLIDPPRAGAKALASQAKDLKAAKLLYVSCNPATLARDAEQLRQAGYELKKLGIMDMFPQTAHVESLALFVRTS